jgi:hypothetical protein
LEYLGVAQQSISDSQPNKVIGNNNGALGASMQPGKTNTNNYKG